MVSLTLGLVPFPREQEKFLKGRAMQNPTIKRSRHELTALLLVTPTPDLSWRYFGKMNPLEKLTVKIFADGADLDGMVSLYKNPLIRGITTNPTLMRKAGIQDYELFARKVLEVVRSKPISF
jgi:hypothetical protein